ncbi:MAG TPA: CYTH domain-containing protein [Pseudomonadales bacterium]|nr:CYTH domain-containing protein [Pseudomonadales bacterium]
MADEFERKFLVTDPAIVTGLAGERMEQGYLPVAAPTSVRVRLTDDGNQARAFLTIKEGRSARHRLEFEYPIPVADAEALLASSCGTARVCKTRYRIEHAGEVWEVDRFADANAPLMLAELELAAADARFETPPWVGVEVTDDVRLLNVNLCRHPLADWPAAERDALLDRHRPDRRKSET